MKKLLLSIGAVFFLAAGAQAQTEYGLKAGLNLGKYSNFGDDQSNNTSFYVTGFADLPIAPQFSIQPGVSLQGKGSKFVADYEDIGAGVEAGINTMSIEVPVNAVYYIPAGAGDVFLGAGPYIGFNVSGKEKLRGNYGDFNGDSEWDMEIGNDKDLKLIDAGVNFMAGYKLNNGLLINAGYGLGLTNVIPNANETVSNRVLSFGIGFQY